jgi:hypothetical protein
MTLEEAEDGGSGDGANTVGTCCARGWAPFMLLATTAVTPLPLPFPLLVPTLPTLLLLAPPWPPLLLLLLALEPVAAALKEERRFWAEDLRRMVGRREGWGSGFEGDMWTELDPV